MVMKHKKPLSQDPSRILVEHFDALHCLKDKPILDIACGYGRNGAFFVNKGYECYFCDIDRDCLQFIEEGVGVCENGSINKSLYKVYSIDFENQEWPFAENSASGIINVHYYNKDIVKKFINTVCVGGFIYIETISARGENYLELPEHKYIYDLMKDKYAFIYYNEKIVKPIELSKATLKLLAIRKY